MRACVFQVASIAKEVPELYEQLHQLSQLRAAYLGVTNQLFDRMLVCVCVCVCVCVRARVCVCARGRTLTSFSPSSLSLSPCLSRM